MSRRADQKVLGYLGRALSLELSAVQLYTTQSCMAAVWGLAEPAERFAQEAREEMGHVERIIGRILALGAVPAASQLRPVGVGAELSELLQYDKDFENELIALYRDASEYCASQGFQDDRLFFRQLMGEEQEHANELDSWLAQVKGTGNGGARF